MNKTLPLRKVIMTALQELHDEVYYEKASTPYQFPYVVFQISEEAEDYGKIPMEIEINVIGYGDDTSDVERISDDIQELFDRWYYIDENMQFTSYKGTRKNLKEKEEDKNLIRRQMRFDVSFYGKG